jgi:2'-5' RNA ligase
VSRGSRSGKPEGWESPFLPGALVILPPARVQQRLNRLRRKYDPMSAWTIPAHITVTQPFRQEPDADALMLVELTVGRHRQMAMRFGPLRNFLPYPCIWFEVQPAETLLALRDDLHRSGLFNTDLPYTEGFVPHMSVTDGTPGPVETEELYRKLVNRVRGGDFPATEVVYTRPDWRFRFLPVRAFALGPR